MHLVLILFAVSLPKIYCLEYEDLQLELLTNYDGDFATLQDGGGNQVQQQGQGQQSNGKKVGLSAGSGLRSIAEGSSNAANDAVNNQDAAGYQAAYVAKNTLAQSAAGASATAQAALAGKQILLQGLEQQFRDAQTALMGEKQQLMQAQRSADATMKAAQEARAHVNVLTNTLNAAQAAADHVTQAASEAAGEFAAQQAMVGAAMDRLENIGKQLAGVRIDFEATRAAAMKAQAAAQVAAANAASAAAAAAAELGKAAKALPPPPLPQPAPPKPAKGGNGGGKAAGAGGSAAGGSAAGGKGKGKGKAAFTEDDYYNNQFYYIE